MSKFIATITSSFKVSKDNTGVQIKDGESLEANNSVINLWNERPNTKFNKIRNRNKSDVIYDKGILPDSIKMKKSEKGKKR